VTPTGTKDFQFHVEVDHPLGGPAAQVQVKDVLAGRIMGEKQLEPEWGLGDPLPEKEALEVLIERADIEAAMDLWNRGVGAGSEGADLPLAHKATPKEERGITESEGA
jgi:hypothetical protein